MAVTFVFNPACVQELRHAPTLAAALRSACEAVLAEAVSDPLPSGGHTYRQSFGVDVSARADGWVGVVYNTDHDAHWVEFGAHAGGVTPVLGYHVLSRALDRVFGHHEDRGHA